MQRWALGALLVWTASVLGCREARQAQEARIEQRSEPLLGGVDFERTWERNDGGWEPACSDDDRAMFRQMMLLGRTVAQGKAVRACVRTTMEQGHALFGPYKPCKKDPFSSDAIERQVQGVLDVLSTPHALRLVCRTGTVGITWVRGQYRLPEVLAEPFEVPNPPLARLFDGDGFSRSTFAASTESQQDSDFRQRVELIAPYVGLIWHEAMHVHAYGHDCRGQTYFESVPYMVQHCVQRVAELSAEHCDMRGQCASGHALAVIAEFPPREGSACECLRDARGGEGTDAPATPVLAEPAPGDRLGQSLAAGDFDGDGFSDLAVGAPGKRDGAGQVFVYRGSIFGLHAAYILERPEARAGDGFGAALAAVDLDGDGIEELAVGVPGRDTGRGEVFVYQGTRAGLSPRGALAAPGRAGERLGAALASATRADAGAAVLAASAPGDGTGAQRGAVRVWRGVTAKELARAWFSVEPSEGEPGDGFGHALALGIAAGSPDVLLAIGAPRDGRGGAVHVARLPRGFETESSTVVPAFVVRQGSGAPEGFGASLAFGRLAGAGTLAIGAPEADASQMKAAGRLYVMRVGPAQAELLQSLQGSAPAARLGSHVLFAGRWALMDQLLAAAPGAPTSLFVATSAFDREHMDFVAVPSEAPQLERPARSFALGDFDGDGVLDVAVGAPDDGATDEVGGQFRVWRRDDAGRLLPWGRYRQSE